MITLESIMGLISLCITCYGLGYSHGRNSKTEK